MAEEGRLVSRDRARIGRLIVLPLSKSFEIAWKSIKLRIWRSLITMSGIILAIAFLMSIFTSGSIVSALQNVPEDDPHFMLIQSVLQQQAIERQSVTIKVGIIGGESAGATGTRMQPQVIIRDFLKERREFSPFLLPQDFDEFTRAFEGTQDSEKPDAVIVTSFPRTLATAEAMNVLGKFVSAVGTLVVIGYEGFWPEQTDAAVRQAFDALLPARPAEGTIEVKPGTVQSVAKHAVSEVNWKEHPAAVYLRTEGVGEAEELARSGETGLLWMGSVDKGLVFWYPLASVISAESGAFQWFLKGRLLVDSLRWGSREKFRSATMAKRNLWLVGLSLLVCIVGITNAMLMSVTERFREIGTMKCLGALDKFIVRLFLIESSLMGAVGSLVGVVIGFSLSFLRALFTYRVADPASDTVHWLALQYFPASTILLWIVASLVIGVFLSVIAAIYPAYRAAKMEPVEAMRVQA